MTTSWKLTARRAVWLMCTMPAWPDHLSCQISDRARLAELVPSPSVSTPPAQVGTSFRLVGPDVRFVWNSDLPYSMNDGALWAGRGASASATLGVAGSYQAQRFRVDAVIAPTLLYSQNRPFDLMPGREPGRSLYSSPWHLTGASADLPLRFGDRPLRRIDAGESEIALRVGDIAAGASNTSMWWGPGIRNALVLSNNAGGIPRAFIRTAQPLKTAIGNFAFEIVGGTLTKSLFFDTLSANDYRSFSGLTVSYRLPGDTGLTIGLARAVYTPASHAGIDAGSVLNVLRWRPRAEAAGQSDLADQVASLYARWVFPAAGFEVYGEWARMEMPASLSDLLQTPYNTQGYTLGLQWAIPHGGSSGIWRLQSEVSYLEQSIVDVSRQPVDFYTGRVASQGYTQRGQIIGASIGPGGSSQWIAVDHFLPRAQLGLFVGRIRWEDDALYRQRFATFFAHDVSLLSGVRGGWRFRLLDVSSELTVARRFNYLFQNGFSNPAAVGTVRVQNITLATRLTPR